MHKAANCRRVRFQSELLEDRLVLEGGATVGGDAHAAIGAFAPPLFQPTADNPVQVVRAIVLNFEPTVPSEGNRTLWQVLGENDPRELAAGFIADMEAASGGAVDYEIVEWRDLNEFPIFTDGFRYTAEQYIANRRTNTGWVETSADFYAIAQQQHLAELVNSRAVDEIWMFGDAYFALLGEAWMAGPESFFINGPSFPEFPVDRAVAGYGFSYERGVAEMLHNHGHRTENHGARAYGDWNISEPVTPWDYFTANAAQTNRDKFGIGSVHYPFSGVSDYDYANERTFSSYADDFVRNFPRQSYAAVSMSRAAWGDLGVGDWQRGYLDWFFGHVPRAAGTDVDGRQSNWFKYIYDFNAYRPDSGLPRDNEAILCAPPFAVDGGSTYEFTLRYYDVEGIDETTFGNTDVVVSQNSGFRRSATIAQVGPREKTTAGFAQTVTYRVAAPGGSWDVSDAGFYSIELIDNAVRDVQGKQVTAGRLGQFAVNLPRDNVIDVTGLLTTGEASVTATPADIGDVLALFDGRTTTLYRTANISPAVVTLNFDTPVDISAFRVVFAGGTAHRWRVESADDLRDLSEKQRTYQLLVNDDITATLAEFDDALLSTPTTAKHVRLTFDKLAGDDFVHLYEWQIVGTHVSDIQSPVAELVAPPTIVGGADATLFNVRYTDDRMLDPTSINSGDVRLLGPNGYVASIGLYESDPTTNGQTIDGTYLISPPGGSWESGDNGEYTLEIVANQVADSIGHSVATGVLGRFVVALPAPQYRPRGELTEGNATDWASWAAGATAATFVDTTRKTAGDSSIRFETTGGFDTYLRYQPSEGAIWDLTGATRLQFQVYAENPSPVGFQVEPIVRLIDVEGNSVDYHYRKNDEPYVLWNDARGTWLSVDIPLDSTRQPSTGWRATTVGSLNMSRITTVEIHADTWDSGFTLWFDNLRFEMAVAGDSTLNSRFDSSDLIQVFQVGEYEDAVVGNSTWLDGDWDGDREFTTADLVLAFQAGNYVLAALSGETDVRDMVLVSAALDESQDLEAHDNFELTLPLPGVL